MKSDEVARDQAAMVALTTELADEPRPRQPYRRPQLRRLGSVRDLTLGSVAGMAEGAGTFRGM